LVHTLFVEFYNLNKKGVKMKFYSFSKIVLIGLIVVLGLSTSGCGTPTPTVVEKESFVNPTIGGYAIDRCYTWAKQCDKPVADAICRNKGYQYSVDYAWEKKHPTKLLTGRICNSPGCGAITRVECVRRVPVKQK